MLGQAGVGLPALISNPEYGQSFRLGLPEKPKLTEATMKQLSQRYPGMAFAHTGPSIEALDINDLNLTERQRTNIARLVNARTNVNADNIGSYVDLANEWAQKPGSGAVTQRMVDSWDNMTPAGRAGLDQVIGQSAGDLLAHYTQYAKSRQAKPRMDLMNLLGVMRDQGMAGVRAGLKSGAFLPGLVGAFLAPALLRESSPEPSAPSGSTR
jgi:hypothetical protein